MPVMSTAITAAVPQTRTTRTSGLLKLSLTELKLLTRERVRAALPIAIPLLLIIVLGNARSLRQPATQGVFPTALQLLTMAGWAVAFGLAAARFFRWE